MNKRGGIFLAVVIAIMLFMTGILMLNFIKPEITSARSSSALDCTNLTISDGRKLTCLGTDITMPYAIIIILSVAGGVIASRLTL